MYIILDQAGNVTDTQYCFIRSSLTWDDGKVFLIYFPVPVLFKIILRLCSANKYLITNNTTNANIQCKFLELIRYIYISYHVEPLNIQNALILFFTFDKIRQRRI